jgi:PAS domain S-box-containing protein
MCYFEVHEIMLRSNPSLLQRIWRPSRKSRIHQLQVGVLVAILVVLRQVANALLMWFTSGAGSWRHLTAAQFFFGGLDYVTFCVILAATGIVLVYKDDAPSKERDFGPIKDLIKTVEAAATGDLTGRPTIVEAGDIGQLSQAIGRLIGVLAKSENQIYHLAALIENSSEAVISHTPDGTIVCWNKGAQRIYGYSAEEITGKPITMLSPIDQGTEIERQLEVIREGNRPQPFETLHVARNGRTVRALVRMSPILDSTRQMIAVSFCVQELIDSPTAPNPSSITSETEDSLAPTAE